MSVSWWSNNAALEVARRGLEDALRGVTCPDHGKHPTVVRHGNDVDFGPWCCPKLEQLAAERLRQRGILP
jgi:hypothetical protein